MRGLRRFALKVAGVFGAGRRDHDIDEELAAHRDVMEREFRRSGMTAAEARRAARAEFGSLASAAQAYRDQRGLPALEAWLADGRDALRSLRRSPILVLSIVLVLGLGIGLSTAMATVFDAAVWRALPVPEADRVVKVSLGFEGEFDRRVRGHQSWLSYPELTSYRTATDALDGLAGISQSLATWRQDAGSRPMSTALVTSDYFRVVRITPALGRVLNAEDAHRPVAVVSHRLWVDSFNRASDVLTRTLVLNRSTYTIAGVLAPGFTGTDVTPIDVWLPLEAATALRGEAGPIAEPNLSWLQAIGRLRPEASIATATAEAAVIAGRWDLDHQGRRTTIGITRASLLDAGLFQSRDRGKLITVGAGLGLVAAILLVICGSNVAALLLARGATREHEIALRIALGAGRRRIAQELVAEVFAIAAAGAALGVLIYALAIRVLAGHLPQAHGLLTASAVDPRVLTVAVALAFGVALVFGLAPLRQALRIDCLAALKADRSVLGVRIPAARLRLWMAAVQVGLSVVLLIVASLLGRGLDHALRVELGYSPRNTFVVRPELEIASGPDALGEQWRLVNGLRNQLAAAPGVVAVGFAAVPPFFGMGFGAMRPDGAGEFVQAHVNAVDQEYFVALGVTPVTGRLFHPGEASAAVVNVSLARRYFGDERAAVGRSIATPGSGREPGTSMTVVGVIGPIQTLRVGLPDDPTYYVPLRDTAPMSPAPALVVRVTDATPVAAIARDRVRQIDNGALVTVTSIEERLAAETGPARIGSAIAGVIGLLALVVAAVGIHGIVAHAVARRTRDIAICLALGASRAQVLRGVMGQTLRAVGLGALTGGGLAVVVAIAFSRPLKALLFGLAPLDPAAFLAATAVLLFVTLVAAYVPARRALGVQPADALRRET